MIPFAGVVDVNSLPETFEGIGRDQARVIHGSTYKDCSTIIIVPGRDRSVDIRVLQTWQSLMQPMNQARLYLFAIGDEVGQAYTNTVQAILAHPQLSKFKYIMTMEMDNLQPPDAHVRLIETIEAGKYDGVSGVYWTKSFDYPMCMAYGSPEHYAKTGELEFRPRDIRAALDKGHVVEVNGIANGCSLYRMDLFREIEPPWFVTKSDVVNGMPQSFTQDLFFCRTARLKGKRFAVDLRVKVGHLDLSSGIVY